MLRSRTAWLVAVAVALVGMGLAWPTHGQAQSAKGATQTETQFADWQTTYGHWTPEQAQQAGYLPTDVCVTAPAVGLPASAGAMGRHFVNPGFIEDGKADADAPDIVLFDSSDRVVGLEFEILTVVDPIPSVAGLPLERTPADPGVDQEHLSLHVYFVGDPADRYSTFNPAVSCGAEAAAAEAPSIAASTATSDSLPSALPAAPSTSGAAAQSGGEVLPLGGQPLGGAVAAPAVPADEQSAGSGEHHPAPAASGAGPVANDAAAQPSVQGSTTAGEGGKGPGNEGADNHGPGRTGPDSTGPDMPGAGIGDLLPGGNATLLGLLASILIVLAAAGRLAAARRI